MLTYGQNNTFPGKNGGLLVVEVVPEILIDGLQLFQDTTLLVVAVMLEYESTSYK